MLAKSSYIAFGFIIGAGLIVAITGFATSDSALQKTGRLNAPIAPIDFQMERFG